MQASKRKKKQKTAILAFFFGRNGEVNGSRLGKPTESNLCAIKLLRSHGIRSRFNYTSVPSIHILVGHSHLSLVCVHPHLAWFDAGPLYFVAEISKTYWPNSQKKC